MLLYFLSFTQLLSEQLHITNHWSKHRGRKQCVFHNLVDYIQYWVINFEVLAGCILGLRFHVHEKVQVICTTTKKFFLCVVLIFYYGPPKVHGLLRNWASR